MAENTYRRNMFLELKRQMREERAPGASAKGAATEARRVIEKRYDLGHDNVAFIRSIEAKCLESCRRLKPSYIVAHAPECVLHRLDRARSEVERRERMCKKHGMPDKLVCPVCYPPREERQRAGKGW
jgi:hypothetical protein